MSAGVTEAVVAFIPASWRSACPKARTAAQSSGMASTGTVVSGR
jgi:hypothetical protein